MAFIILMRYVNGINYIHFEITGDPWNLIGQKRCNLFPNYIHFEITGDPWNLIGPK